MDARALEGRGILVTRPAGQAGPLARRIEAAGGNALAYPALDIEPLAERPLPPLAGLDMVVFVSPTAVCCAFERSTAWTGAAHLAAVGKGTRRELEARGVRDVIAPQEGGDSEALLAEPALQAVQGRRILIVKGEDGRDALAETLRGRGAAVELFECYRRVAPQTDPAPLAAAWDRGEVHAVTATSAQGLDHLIERFGAARLARTPLFVTHPRIAEHARAAGLAQVRVAGPGDDELAAALVAYFAPPMSDSNPQPEAPPREPASRAPRAPLLLALLLALVAAAAVAGWLDARSRIDATQQELARRLRDIEADAREARAGARQAQDATREAQTRIGQLEARLAESHSQQLALEALYQDLSRNRDEWQLAEIEQVLAIAAQQLQLAGNVRAALLALQLAESRLERSDRPQFLALRRALARDIERLKALPALDVTGMTVRLDGLIAQVDALPVAFEKRAEPPGAPKAAEPEGERGFWGRLAAEVWGELRQLVVVRHADSREPPLLAPTHEYFLRENLRLRLLNARLSLLARDEAGYREDLRVAQAWIQRYFDPRSRHTAEALSQLKQLSAATVTFKLPSLAESLEAVRGVRQRRERGPQ
ncbi:MAG TPA: uroporphyrinogen-III C-methyltransferase [Burkholderiales bacterium]|nr:uroporphyrinogen-III C-methyltransferase [Burkholderiales bacterium]